MATFPERALAWLNGVLRVVVDAGLGPLLGWSPGLSLVIVAVATAVVMVLVVARTADQKRVRQAKRGVHAALFEIRLFNDDLRVVMRALGDLLRHNAVYLRLSLVPLAWMAIPLACSSLNSMRFMDIRSGARRTDHHHCASIDGSTTPGNRPAPRGFSASAHHISGTTPSWTTRFHSCSPDASTLS